jgi:hypothetical protein
MAISLTCPSCKHGYAVPDELAGYEALCPNCQTRFRIAPPPGVEAPPRPEQETQTVVTCPTCGESYPIRNTHLGHAIVCTKCFNRFRVRPPEDVHRGEDSHTTITCPNCSYSHPVPNSFLGRVVGCPRCRALFVIRRPPPERGFDGPGVVELPAPTVWPFVLGAGIAFLLASLATNLAFALIGGTFLAIGLGGWIAQLTSAHGHVHEPFVEPEKRPRRIRGRRGTVAQLQAGMPGYRLQLPLHIHPISAGIKGGILGGILMPLPAFGYGIISGHGIWFPINLLAGMVLPGVDQMSDAELQQFHLGMLILGIFIHVVFSVVIGLIYGVLMPTLPTPPGPLFWGGVLLPVVWTGVSFGMMGVVNPILQVKVDWPWFALSQFVYGMAAALVVVRSQQIRIPPVGTGPGEEAEPEPEEDVASSGQGA